MTTVDPRLIEILRCPVCADHPKVKMEGDALVCAGCGRLFPVSGGIPDMVVRDVDQEQLASSPFV